MRLRSLDMVSLDDDGKCWSCAFYEGGLGHGWCRWGMSFEPHDAPLPFWIEASSNCVDGDDPWPDSAPCLAYVFNPDDGDWMMPVWDRKIAPGSGGRPA